MEAGHDRPVKFHPISWEHLKVELSAWLQCVLNWIQKSTSPVCFTIEGDTMAAEIVDHDQWLSIGRMHAWIYSHAQLPVEG